MNFYQFKLQQKEFYKSIGKVYSPALKSDVYFRADGFHHLLYKESERGRQRSRSEQALKLNCLSYVVMVVENTLGGTTLRRYGGKSLIALVYEVREGLRIRVIVRKSWERGFTFLSVMPNDKQSALTLKKQRTSPK